MNIDRVKHLNHLFLIELVSLLEKLEATGLNIEAYIKHIISRIDRDEFGLFIAWDEDGLHGAIHMNAPGSLFPDRCWMLYSCTDSSMPLSTSRKFLEAAESYAKDKGAKMWQSDTERSVRAFERAYGTKAVGHIVQKNI